MNYVEFYPYHSPSDKLVTLALAALQHPMLAAYYQILSGLHKWLDTVAMFLQ